MENQKISFRQKTREKLLLFLDEKNKHQHHIPDYLEKLQIAKEKKAHITMQVQGEFGKVATYSGWVVQIENNKTITFRLSKSNQFVFVEVQNVLQISYPALSVEQ